MLCDASACPCEGNDDPDDPLPSSREDRDGRMDREGRSVRLASSLSSPHVTAPGFRIVLIFLTSRPIMLVRFSRFSSVYNDISVLLGFIVGGLDAND